MVLVTVVTSQSFRLVMKDDRQNRSYSIPQEQTNDQRAS